VSRNQEYEYRGDPARRPGDAHPDSPTAPEPYVASGELKRAVNLAIFLRRPLLLEGEAGCGKTRLSRAVAHELGLPFYTWYVRSTSKAREGLYNYDAILRLHDVQTHQLEAQRHGEAAGGEIPPEGRRDPSNPMDYREFGALGKAFCVQDRPAVVLIDEIDKADIDFPNDLLAVLDDPWQFEIPETGETVTAQQKPIVIITSNKEKGNLPAPFLRRCIYYFIEFPGTLERLQAIVDEHYKAGEEPVPSPELVTAATERFLTVRQDGGLHKKPGTSEFLDWLRALHSFGAAPHAAQALETEGAIPYPELLYKLRMDWQRATAAGRAE
jgi:MoxR-like ATPase